MHRPAAAAAQVSAGGSQPDRRVFLDRLRILLTALVVLHHTAITYGAMGGWYWRDPGVLPIMDWSTMLLSLFCAVNQSFFMGFFFLIAGYFTPPALARKGEWRFVKDRLYRLGIPLLAYGLVLGPLTAAMATTTAESPFAARLLRIGSRPQFNIGPLWFAEALLLFALGYLLWRRLRPQTVADQSPPLPGRAAIFVSALGVGAAAFALRLVFPVGTEVMGLQLGYFASYVFLYAVGCAASRNAALERIAAHHARPCLLVSLLALPLLPAVLIVSGNFDGGAGGWNAKAAIYAFWEPLLAWGIMLSLLWQFRLRGDRPGPATAWLAERAYAVFIAHPPVLVGISMLFAGWPAPPLLKFALVGALTCCACLACASLALLIPGSRRVL